MSDSSVIEHGSTGAGRWLRARRNRIALWIAVVEAIIVAVAHDASSWTVMAVAAVAVAIYWYWGRSAARSDLARQLSWIFAASQVLAFVAAIVGLIIGTLVLIVAGIFAAVALLILFSDRR